MRERINKIYSKVNKDNIVKTHPQMAKKDYFKTLG